MDRPLGATISKSVVGEDSGSDDQAYGETLTEYSSTNVTDGSLGSNGSGVDHHDEVSRGSRGSSVGDGL
jgi:hypothetical protein